MFEPPSVDDVGAAGNADPAEEVGNLCVYTYITIINKFFYAPHLPVPPYILWERKVLTVNS